MYSGFQSLMTNLAWVRAQMLIEDVEADTLRETTGHLVLTVDTLVVGQPREIVALRFLRRDVPAVLWLCATSARWGVLLRQ